LHPAQREKEEKCNVKLFERLNGEGFTPALNCAIGKRWYSKKGAVDQAEDGGEVQANAKAKEPVGGVAVEKVGGGEVDKNRKKVAAGAVKLIDPEADPELSQDDEDALESAQIHIEALERFLREEATKGLSDAAKAELGRAIGRLNTVAGEAGITVITE
jgi:hypothetical protein